MGQRAGDPGPGRGSDGPTHPNAGAHSHCAGVRAPHIQRRTSICIGDNYRLREPQAEDSSWREAGR